MLIGYHTRRIRPLLDRKVVRTQLNIWQCLMGRLEPEGRVASKLT